MIQDNQRYHLFYFTHSSYFLKPAAYITHNATLPLGDITESNSVQLHLEPQKFIFNMCSSTPQDL